MCSDGLALLHYDLGAFGAVTDITGREMSVVIWRECPLH